MTPHRPAQRRAGRSERAALAAFVAVAALAAGPALAATTPAAQPAPAAAPGKTGEGAAASIEAMVGGKLDQTLTKIGATDDQKTKIKSVMITALGQLMALQPQVKATPKTLEKALTAPTVDRALLEQTRVQLIATLDQGSKTLFQALADAADTLTPDQRAKLAAMLAPKPKS